MLYDFINSLNECRNPFKQVNYFNDSPWFNYEEEMMSRNPFKQVNYFNSDLFNIIYFNDVKELFRRPNEQKNKFIGFLVKNSITNLIIQYRKPPIRYTLPKLSSNTDNYKLITL